jgi:hypothetical protein
VRNSGEYSSKWLIGDEIGEYKKEGDVIVGKDREEDGVGDRTNELCEEVNRKRGGRDPVWAQSLRDSAI